MTDSGAHVGRRAQRRGQRAGPIQALLHRLQHAKTALAGGQAQTPAGRGLMASDTGLGFWP